MFSKRKFFPSYGCDSIIFNSRRSGDPTKPRQEHLGGFSGLLSANSTLVLALALASCVFVCALSGCGSSYTVTAAGIGSFQSSSDDVEFGNVQVGQTADSTLTLINQGSTAVSVSDLKITGNQFSIASSTSLPITVAANSSYNVDVQFKPNASGDSTGQLAVSSSSKSSPSLKVKLHGKGTATAATSSVAALSSFSCNQSSVTGAGSDACTVNLSAAAGSGGLVVSLSSDNGAVTVPASVTISAGSTSAGFTAAVAAVTTVQTATLTASAAGATETYGIALDAYVPGLQLSSASLNFGGVTVNSTSAGQTVTLTSSGAAPLTINSAGMSGAGFRMSGASFPATLNPGQTASVTVVFDPTVAGTASGAISISDNASPSAATISLNGTGMTGSGTLSRLSCATNALTGSGNDACTVTLSAAATGSGVVVALGSNVSAASVPGSVTVPAGATSAGFTATISAVTTAQTATFTASEGGATQTYSIGLGAYVPGLKLSTSNLNFGSVTVNTSSAPQSVTLTSSGTAPLTINSAGMSGGGFRMSGASFPATLNPGQTATLAVTFDPTVSGTSNVAINITDNASPSTASISMSGTGQAAAGVLSALSCSQNSISGSGSDACTVSLSAPAGAGGQAVSLSSSNSAATVPGSVTVPAGSTSVGFTANVSAVTTAQTATLTASAGGVAETYAITLGATEPGLTLGTTSISFGSVNLNSPATQQVLLSSTGAAPLTISAGGATGSGFSISGVSFPATLNPGQSATLYIQFDPTTAGAASGTVTLTSNASPSTATISMSGTGAAVSYQVNLTWSAPTNSSDPVSGYNVYRTTGSSSSYQLQNPSPNTSTAYSDTTVQSGSSYSYYVESVDASGNQSGPSNTYTVSIP